MRRLLLTGLLGVAACRGALAQQFGQDRPATPAPVAPMAPVIGGPTAAPAPAPAPLFTPSAAPLPASATAPAAPPPVAQAGPGGTHPWASRPEYGAWMVCVKSYTGPEAQARAEELATLIRKQHNAATYLYEWGAEERQREEARRDEFRKAKREELTPFLKLQDQQKREAQAKGMEFVEAPVRIKMPILVVKTQWAVLIGGFPDMDAGHRALMTIRNWPAPSANHLLDSAIISTPGEKGANSEGGYINPYKVAMVVPNPANPKGEAQTAPALDPAIVKLNAEEPLSLLRCPKAFTLTVKDFPVQASTQMNRQEGGVIGRLFGNGADQLEETAKTAREFAKVIRDPKMQQAAQDAATRLGMKPQPLESFVLHVRTGSRVTVGQFDAIDDPALLEMQRLLANMSFKVEQPGKPPEERRMFDGITPMPVPRAK